MGGGYSYKIIPHAYALTCDFELTRPQSLHFINFFIKYREMQACTKQGQFETALNGGKQLTEGHGTVKYRSMTILLAAERLYITVT